MRTAFSFTPTAGYQDRRQINAITRHLGSFRWTKRFIARRHRPCAPAYDAMRHTRTVRTVLPLKERHRLPGVPVTAVEQPAALANTDRLSCGKRIEAGTNNRLIEDEGRANRVRRVCRILRRLPASPRAGVNHPSRPESFQGLVNCSFLGCGDRCDRP